MHYIRHVVVEKIVLENLREVIHYVSNYEDDFVRMVMDADMKQKSRELAQQKRRLAEIQKRIGELDTIFQRIYEDNIIGKLSDERFMKMSKGYEDEQRTLQAETLRRQYQGELAARDRYEALAPLAGARACTLREIALDECRHAQKLYELLQSCL